jgi:hypothetical protein
MALGQQLPDLDSWKAWFREADSGSAQRDAQAKHGTGPVVRIEHHGGQDWAYTPNLNLPVKPGDLLELAVDVKVEGDGELGPCFSTFSAPGKALDWTAGYHAAAGASDWHRVSARVIVPPGATLVQPRIVGYRAATVWLVNPKLVHSGNVLANRDLPHGLLTLSNAFITVEYHAAQATYTVRDNRTGAVWKQLAPRSQLLPLSARLQSGNLEAEFADLHDDLRLRVTSALEPDRPELAVSLTAKGAMSRSLDFPAPFATAPGQYLVVPMNEGISYPADDPAMPTLGLVAYGGHGICMGFFGATDGTRGWMGILQTPDDALLQLGRTDGLNWAALNWQPQRGQFGYQRQVRYVFFDQGGHVPMAKRYRQYAKEIGRFKTFAEKKRERPQVDKLLGAVNVWCWDREAASIVKELREAGVERLLWSNQLPPEQIQQLNALGVLTSRYDIYQDLMDPANFPRIRYRHQDWTTEGFPKDIILDRQGRALPGWEIELKDGPGMVPCAVLCDLKAPDYALKRIAEDLATHPYACRFIDTTTAAPWRECYNPAHPMTRTQSREAKMKLLGLVSDHFKLVCGSETGHDSAVPWCDYFEGMMSLGPYRLNDAGRHTQRIETNVPPKLAQVQVGEKYRLPLWELVYHDCCVAQWYWGDYNNKLPPIWKKRDLFNALYGTPPMFMFDRKLWHEQQQRFVESYLASAAITRATAGSEMTDHRFLTPDRRVQQTVFANGARVTVNFGDIGFSTNGVSVAPGAVRAENLP